MFCFFFSSRRRHTRCALVTGVQTCALPISPRLVAHLVEHLPRPAVAVIGEPTMMRPVNAHKGLDAFRTRVRGKEAHSRAPQDGASAILPAVHIVDSIARAAAARSDQRRVGKACVSTCKSRRSPYHYTNNTMTPEKRYKLTLH